MEREKGESVKGNRNRVGKVGNATGVGNTDTMGKTARVGKTASVGKATMIGNVTREFEFRKVRGRREFFDTVKDYVEKRGSVKRSKLVAYFQYTTGASPVLIHQAVEVLAELGLIEVADVSLGSGSYDVEIKKVRA